MTKPNCILRNVTSSNFDQFLLQEHQLLDDEEVELGVLLSLLVHVVHPFRVTSFQECSHPSNEILWVILGAHSD